eukprot:COSAG01_NODE_5334_length_4326_cov_144.633073_3_plen_77_part_00
MVLLLLLLAFCGANCVRGIRKNVARPKAVTAYQYWVVVVAVRPRARQGQPLGGEAVRGGCWVVRAGVWNSFTSKCE